jgi:TolA-binding protein
VAVAVLALLWQSESSSRERAKQEAAAQQQAVAAAQSTPPRRMRPPPSLATPSTMPGPAANAPVDARPPSPPARPTEASLMERLRKARAAGQHALAIQLAREGNRRFPDSAFAPERHSILIHSLADNEQRTEARGEAEQMVNHFPDSDWVREIERFTGAHRHRNVRLNDAGEIEYY